MDFHTAIEQLVRKKALRLAIASTGAGAGVQKILWSVPGISAILEEAIFPYSEVAIHRFVQRPLGRMLHQESAIALACAAFLRAQEGVVRDSRSQPPLGVGITAAVATNRTRRGPEQIHLAIRDSETLRCASFEFERGKFSRAQAGAICDQFGINAILSWAQVEQIAIESTLVGMHGDFDAASGRVLLRQLEYARTNQSDDFVIDQHGAIRSPAEILSKRHLILPSSLNPFHFGHDGLAQRAVEETGRPVIFELSLSNVDKAELALDVALKRAIQLRGRWPLLVTRGATLFVQKARRYGCSFIVGLDTAERIISTAARYNDGRANEQIVAELHQLGVQFFVAERGSTGTVANLSLAIPEMFKNLFVKLTGRWEVSSTELRARSSV